ncbi:BAR adaptor protein Hob3 [Teratosphaeriaceae sp. CCFEE 6253]|nr:BAR adaptor protein Hob3 [Teratosphaeriaceae sp. CCFEE 6253]
MSWSGFKKAASRAGTQVMMKTGHVEKTSDRSYEVEERRYRTLESASLRLQKEAKGYLDSLRAMTASQMRIAETIDAFYGEAGAKDGVSRSYKQAVEDLDAETVKALDGPYRCVMGDGVCAGAFEEEEVLDHGGIGQVYRGGWRGSRSRDIGLVAQRRRGCDGGVAQRESEGFATAHKLMESVYRTTVLEPISRFCAYFPDINECIKKRNNKLLDYDAVRAKVRKLTEKPDKDPSKLPRTEKEAEMVSLTAFLRETSSASSSSLPPTKVKLVKPPSPEKGGLLDVDLTVPSPPKQVLERMKRELQQQEAEFLRLHSGMTGLRGSPGCVSRVAGGRSSPRYRDESDGEPLLPQQSPTFASHGSTERAVEGQTGGRKGPVRGSSTEARTLSRSKSRPRKPDPESVQEALLQRTPFFHPSELEQLMQPLRQEYRQTKADECTQARVAYEQLNEQLSTELPQLIDLRVPYLDPSFEALVKIQLRFCAEAYSRMAQVQQYMDASTRDQYASGDLDARVEDVLGQIRELSIAGTV